MPKVFETFAAQNKPRIDAWLHEYLQKTTDTAQQTAAYNDLLIELQTLIDRGGKRLRPLLCWVTYEGYGGKDVDGVMPAFAAQELLHTFLLIHDDIIDRDFRRWNGQNISGVYFERYSKVMTPRDALHFAQSQALLAGDVCQNLATQALLQVAAADDVRLQLQKMYNQTTLQVLEGELADIAFERAGTVPTSQAIRNMYQHKTASYSGVLPLQTGALLAAAPVADIELLAEIGRHVGLAYQLQDDVLGIFGDESLTGKSTLGDIREGKYTLLMAKALELAMPVNAKKLRKILGNDQVNQTDVQTAQTIITNCGAKAAVSEAISAASNEAIDLVSQTHLQTSAQHQLIDAITLLVNRVR